MRTAVSVPARAKLILWQRQLWLFIYTKPSVYLYSAEYIFFSYKKCVCFKENIARARVVRVGGSVLGGRVQGRPPRMSSRSCRWARPHLLDHWTMEGDGSVPWSHSTDWHGLFDGSNYPIDLLEESNEDLYANLTANQLPPKFTGEFLQKNVNIVQL